MENRIELLNKYLLYSKLPVRRVFDSFKSNQRIFQTCRDWSLNFIPNSTYLTALSMYLCSFFVQHPKWIQILTRIEKFVHFSDFPNPHKMFFFVNSIVGKVASFATCY